MKERSAGTEYEFRYERTTLYHLVKKLGFQFQAADNRKVIMESPGIVAWRYEYLKKMVKFRSKGYLIVYHDEIGSIRMTQQENYGQINQRTVQCPDLHQGVKG